MTHSWEYPNAKANQLQFAFSFGFFCCIYSILFDIFVRCISGLRLRIPTVLAHFKFL